MREEKTRRSTGCTEISRVKQDWLAKNKLNKLNKDKNPFSNRTGTKAISNSEKKSYNIPLSFENVLNQAFSSERKCKDFEKETKIAKTESKAQDDPTKSPHSSKVEKIVIEVKTEEKKFSMRKPTIQNLNHSLEDIGKENGRKMSPIRSIREGVKNIFNNFFRSKTKKSENGTILN